MDNIIRCFIYEAKTNIYEDHCVCKIVPLILQINDFMACVYDRQLIDRGWAAKFGKQLCVCASLPFCKA